MNDFSQEGGEGMIIDGHLKKDQKQEDKDNKSKDSGEGFIIDGTLKKESQKRNEASWIQWLKKFGRGAAAGTVIGMAGMGAGEMMTSNTNAANNNEEKSQDVGEIVSIDKQDNPNKQVVESAEKVQESEDLFDIVFHDLTPEQREGASALVDEFVDRLRVKPEYERQHRDIPEKYKEVIRKTAEENNLPFEMLYGIIAIESGGGEDITNESSGARGVAQFLPDTARQYGLTVDDSEDERGEAVPSIKAAGRYLRDHLDMLNNDVGLAMWSYHAGIGNVNRALSVYFQDQYGEDIGFADGNVDIAKTKELIEKYKLDFFKLTSNPAVQSEVIADLHDHSEDYVPSIMAILQLNSESEIHDLGDGLTVAVPKDTFSGR